MYIKVDNNIKLGKWYKFPKNDIEMNKNDLETSNNAMI